MSEYARPGQRVSTHCHAVGKETERLLQLLGPEAAYLGLLTGVLHDFPKMHPDWAPGRPGRPDHATIAAHFLLKKGFRILPKIVVGHHGGLPQTVPGGFQGFCEEVEQSALFQELNIPDLDPSVEDRFFSQFAPGVPRQLAMRVFLSALIDADRTDSEAAGDAESLARAKKRKAYRREAFSGTGTLESLYLQLPSAHDPLTALLKTALEKAISQGSRRVILVFPHISTIQFAGKLYREYLGDSVLEIQHTPTVLNPNAEKRERYRILSESGDSPILLMTVEEFAETLFAKQTSRLRKLHNFTHSTIMLVDSQGHIPLDLCGFWEEALETLGAPVLGCVVLVKERTRVLPPIEVRSAPVPWEQLGAELQEYQGSALVCLNTRKEAQGFASFLGPDVFHLSSLLRHLDRMRILQEVERRVRVGESIVLVSTPMGTHLSFPFARMYRAFAPLGSMLGMHPETEHILFSPAPWEIPPGQYGVEAGMVRADLLLGRQTAKTLFTQANQDRYRDLLTSSPTTRQREMRRHVNGGDFGGIQLNFKLIDDPYNYVLVPHGVAGNGTPLRTILFGLLDQARNGKDYETRKLAAHRISAFLVPVPKSYGSPWNWEGDFLLWEGDYDDRLGLIL